MSASLPTLEETEKLATAAETFVQTYRARARRIDTIRKVLATLTEQERLALLSESLGITVEDLVAVTIAGSEALRTSSADVREPARIPPPDAT